MASFGKQQHVDDFDTSQSDYSPLPEGIYGMEITESDVDEKTNGKQAQFTATVLAPEAYEGRTLFIREWHEHTSETAQRIGNNNIAKLARAVGITGYEATEDFHGRAFVAKVGFGKPYEKKKDGIPVRDSDGNVVMTRNNEVKRYYFPEEDIPEPFVASDELPPIGAPANDNRRPAANDNARPAAAKAAASGAKKRPWDK